MFSIGFYYGVSFEWATTHSEFLAEKYKSWSNLSVLYRPAHVQLFSYARRKNPI